MILYLSFEELAALAACAETALAPGPAPGHGVAAPSRIQYEIEQFALRLDGDVAIETLTDHERIQRVISHLLDDARARVDEAILLEHAAAESAVAAYFTFAHVLAVHDRLIRIGEEMAALAELMTGDDPESESARRFRFPE
jgi:hypothetical protein